MEESGTGHVQIEDSNFQEAVRLIDTGATQELQDLLLQHPQLLSMTAEEGGEFAGDYFASPRLLWFVAENPIRNNRLPPNIVDVIQVVVDASVASGVEDLTDVLNYTLALVASGKVARESGLQPEMCRKLVDAGADPNSGMESSLAHGERPAGEVMLDCGAELTLPVAAGLGRDDDVNRLLDGATDLNRQKALIMASINGQHRSARILADSGTDLNAFNPPGLHAHSTPLHQAVSSGCVRTVCSLVTRGADLSIRDRIFNGTAADWARECGHEDLVEFLRDAGVMMAAVNAVRYGRCEDLHAWLEQHADRVNQTIGDNPRTLLHYATDWPGKLPRVAESIRALVAAGADVNARFVGPSTQATETPLHWAASSDDIEAADVLIELGADLDALGGCIDNGSPLTLAVIFQNWRVANRLVDAGCRTSLPLVSGIGRMDLVKTFFDESGELNDARNATDAKRQLGSAMVLASMGGHLEVAEYLIERDAPVNAVSPIQTTPLDEALKRSHHELARVLKECGAVRFQDTAGED